MLLTFSLVFSLVGQWAGKVGSAPSRMNFISEIECESFGSPSPTSMVV